MSRVTPDTGGTNRRVTTRQQMPEGNSGGVLSDTTVTNYETGRKLLDKKNYVPAGDPTSDGLIGALRLIAEATKSALERDLLLALAYYAEDATWKRQAAYIAEVVFDRVRTIQEQADSTAQDMGDTLGEWRNTIAELKREHEQTRTETEETKTMVKTVLEHLAETKTAIADNTTTVAAKLDDLAQANPPSAEQPSPNALPRNNTSYADALRLQNDSALQREKTRARQLLIEGASYRTENGDELDERALLQKATIAYDTMGLFRLDCKTKPTFVSVQKLKRGGLVYELESAESAEYLRQPDVKALFLREYGVGEIKDRTWTVVFDTVPTSFDPSLDAHRMSFNNFNDPIGDHVVELQFIKAPERRREGQARAALLATFNDKRAANRAIKDGLIFIGRRVMGRKWFPEPRRCGRCYKVNSGHRTTDCKQVHTTCGRCGRVDPDHATHACPERNQDQLRCVNCKTNGHATVDKDCPQYLEALQRQVTRSPEVLYRYFVDMQDPTTWIRLDVDDAHAPYENTWASRRTLRAMAGPNQAESHTYRFDPRSGYYPEQRYRMWGARPTSPREPHRQMPPHQSREPSSRREDQPRLWIPRQPGPSEAPQRPRSRPPTRNSPAPGEELSVHF